MLKNGSVFSSNIINSNIDKNVIAGLAMGRSADGQMTSGYADSIEKLATSYREASAEANALRMTQDGLTESTIKDILAKQNWSKAEIDAAISSNTFKAAQEASTSATLKDIVATKAWSATKKAASIVGGMVFATSISIGIASLVKFADSIINAKKHMKEASDTAKQTINDLKDSFDTLKSSTDGIKQRYAELAQGVDQLTGKNLKLSDGEYEEFLDLSNQLAELFPSLTSNYDENGNAIVDLTGDVNYIISSLDTLIKKEQELANQKILDEMPDVYAELADNVSKYNRELKSYQLFKDSMPDDVEISNFGKTSFKLDEPYYLGKDFEKEIKNKFKEKLKEYEIDGASVNINNIHDGVAQFNISGLKNTEEYREKINKIYDEIKVDIVKKIQETNASVKTEMDDFNKYIYTWLSQDIDYAGIDNEGLKTAIQQLLFNSNWINDLPDNIDASKWNKELENWLKTNYLNAINNINDDEYKQKLANLFTMDLKPQQKINLAQELQDYFNQNNIKVSLDFILNGDVPTSEQNLVNRLDTSLKDLTGDDTRAYSELVKYTGGFSESQMNIWLEETKDAINAGDAIYRYEKYLDDIANKNYNFDFFTEDNVESIDNYKGKISDLSTYLSTINEKHKLSAEEMAALNTEYGISANSVEEYEQAIIDMMNKLSTNSEVIIALKDAIENCNDATKKEQLQSLYDNLININTEAQRSADSFGNLDTAISTLQSKAETLRSINDAMREVGYIDSSHLDEIISTYPELESKVAEFNAGLITSQELFSALEKCYNEDREKYVELITEKLQYNTEFYSKVVSDLPEWITKLAESYDIDFNNFKDLCEAKLALQKELVAKQATLDVARTIVDNLHDDDPSNDSMYMTLEDATNDKFDPSKNLVDSKKQVSDIERIINGLNATLSTSLDLDTSWKEFGKDLTSMTEIDWADQSLKVLQEEVDDAQTALDDTHGFDAQIQAITELNNALKKLKNGYKKAYKEYDDRYTDALSKLSDGETIRKYIESGTEFDLSKYDPETAKIIQEAIDAYNSKIEAENKIAELDEQISDNNKLEKSKVRQEKYETKLSGVQTDLGNDNLTAKEKNDLLTEQLKNQNKINDELISQAEYEGDILEVENLKKENKQNERDNIAQKWQNKIDENQNTIDAKNTLLENKGLTESEIDDINSDLEDLTKTDYKYKFKQIIKQLDVDNKWSDYINDLKKKYGQEDVKTKQFVQEHIQEIMEHFSYTGMEGLYYEFLNSMDDFEDDEYENHSTTRSYYINDNNNKIANIQSDIDYAGGRGTEQQYRTMQTLHQSNLDYWTQQKKEVEAFLNQQDVGTEKWDEWNAKVQECDSNIKSCERSIKDCNIEILSLPLNDIEDELKDIENQLYTVNDLLDDYNTYISAANFILDTQIREENLKKELLEDQVTALEKTNEARNTELELQKSLYNLEKLRNQKTEKVYHEGQGWVYESNVDDVKNAQKEYDDAVYNKQVTGLNLQIKEYDENIKKLNRIKDKWSVITTNAQGSVDLNKALTYDSDFFNKVLNGDTSLIDDIQNNMTNLTTSKDALEEEQEKYQELQDLINDTIEAYELEAIVYEFASKKISDAIKTYFPEISEKYNFESGKLQEIIDKKETDAETTKTSTESINETINESNQKLLESYTKFKDDLGKVFEGLNSMLQTYVENTNAMATTIATTISQIQSQINSIASLSASVSITSDTTTDDSKGKDKKNKVDGAIKNHKGLELGYIGESSLSKDKEAFKYIALSELKDDEFVRVLQKGEAVLDSSQIQNTMSNFRKLAQFKVPTIVPNNTNGNQSVSFTGDIVINNPIGDSSKLAREIKLNLGNQLLQELYSNK